MKETQKRKKMKPEERCRKTRLNGYSKKLDKLIAIQRDLDFEHNLMSDTQMDEIDIRVYNGLGSAVYGLQAVMFCLRECQLADEAKFETVSENPNQTSEEPTEDPADE